jgi:hypothetical protein
MENINIADFISYFGSYYPVIIPVLITLLIISSYVLDLIRAWCIKYVDEGESGPYKEYVLPALNKLLGLRTKSDVPDWMQLVHSSFTSGSISPRMVYSIKLGSKYACSNYSEDIKRIQKYKDKCDGVEEEALLFKCLYTSEHKTHTVFDTALELGLRLAVILMALTAYKFLPELTIGALIGYAVLRVARSVVRLTKRFNKHISDGHGAQTTEDVSDVK